METAGVEPAPPRCKRGVLPEEPHPRVRPQAPGSPGADPEQREPCSPPRRVARVSHIGLSADGWSRTTTAEGVGVTARGAHRYSASARSSAGGIRTHGLELMRLARTAAPLPRKSGRLESNQRSPVPETGGMAELPYSQVEIDDRGIEPCVPAVSERCLPSRPVVDASAAATPPPSGICPAAGWDGAAGIRFRGFRLASRKGVARESHPAPRVHRPRARY